MNVAKAPATRYRRKTHTLVAVAWSLSDPLAQLCDACGVVAMHGRRSNIHLVRDLTERLPVDDVPTDDRPLDLRDQRETASQRFAHVARIIFGSRYSVQVLFLE